MCGKCAIPIPVRAKRPHYILAALSILAMLIYCSLLVHQNGLLTIPQLVDTPKQITLDDIFISVKTTSRHYDTRLPIILKTWFQLAKDQTWFFTDDDNKTLQEYTGGHIMNTGCKSSHSLIDLCCKTNAELDFGFSTGKKWFCHFDDDNFVNVPRLVAVLQNYDYEHEWYLGKRSVKGNTVYRFMNNASLVTNFAFATGGAGYCISGSLATKMDSFTRHGRFVKRCQEILRTDDVTMGYISEYLLRRNLTEVPEFHSHLENMSALDSATFQDQISFGYHLGSPEMIVRVPGVNVPNDTTRFLSLHCYLFPHLDSDFCDKRPGLAAYLYFFFNKIFKF